MQDVKVDREKYIGGSDIPIIMGISPYKTRFDLLLEKASLVVDDFEGNEYTEYGNVMEPKIREFVNSSINRNFVEGKHIIDDIRCHTDGEDETAILEIKTTSKIYDKVEEYKIYLVQLLFYMIHAKRKIGFLAVYHRPSDFVTDFNEERLHLYMIDINDYQNLVDDINKAVDTFRIDLEKVKANPFITEEELMPLDITEISNKVIALETKLAEYKKIEQEQKELKAQLKSAMENNNIKKWETTGGYKITLIEDGADTEVEVFNEDKFKEENEDLYKKYLETKIKKGRAGSLRITAPKGE